MSCFVCVGVGVGVGVGVSMCKYLTYFHFQSAPGSLKQPDPLQPLPLPLPLAVQWPMDNNICQYKIMRHIPPQPLNERPWGILAARVEVAGAFKNWLLMKTIENSQAAGQPGSLIVKLAGKGNDSCPTLEQSKARLLSYSPPRHLVSPSGRLLFSSTAQLLDCSTGLRLLISIKAFNRQAQTAGNILFIWGFCLHNRQESSA